MSDMAAAYVTHRIDIDEYHRMAEAGVFDSEKHIELIDGELIERVAPMDPPHAGVVSKITNMFAMRFIGRADVRNQVPVTLGSHSEPLPDLAVVTIDPHAYERQHPTPNEIHLLVEVCDSSRDEDRRRKVPLYARNDVVEVWLVDLVDSCLRTYRGPHGGHYRKIGRLERGERLASLAFPDISLAVSDLLAYVD